MDLVHLVENMSEDMYLRLKCASETGRWPEGTKVDEQQRQSALQITMAYQAKHLNSDEMMTIGADGNMVIKSKAELKQQFSQPDLIAKFDDL